MHGTDEWDQINKVISQINDAIQVYESFNEELTSSAVELALRADK